MYLTETVCILCWSPTTTGSSFPFIYINLLLAKCCPWSCVDAISTPLVVATGVCASKPLLFFAEARPRPPRFRLFSSATDFGFRGVVCFFNCGSVFWGTCGTSILRDGGIAGGCCGCCWETLKLSYGIDIELSCTPKDCGVSADVRAMGSLLIGTFGTSWSFGLGGITQKPFETISGDETTSFDISHRPVVLRVVFDSGSLMTICWPSGACNQRSGVKYCALSWKVSWTHICKCITSSRTTRKRTPQRAHP